MAAGLARRVSAGAVNLALSAEDYDEAEARFRRQRQTAAQLLEAGHDTPENTHRVANALRKLAVVKQQRGALVEADQLFRECLHMLDRAATRHAGHPLVRRLAALAYEDQAYLAFLNKDPGAMLRLHTAARTILEDLVKNGPAPEDQVALAKVYEQFAFMARFSGQHGLERHYWSKAWDMVWAGYLAESENLGYRERLSVVSGQLAEARYGGGQLQEALPMYLLSVTLSEALFQQGPEEQGALRRLIDARETYAERLSEAGRKGDAENQYRLLRGDAERVLQLSRPNATTLLATAEAFLTLGDHGRDGRQLQSAEADFLRAIELTDRARRERAPPEAADYIALMAHGNLVLVAVGLQTWDRLRVHLDRAEALLSIVEKSDLGTGDSQIDRLRRLLADVRASLR